MKIISVDDEQWPSNLLYYMITQLKTEDCRFAEVAFAASFTRACEALEYLKTHKIELVFLDVEMPEMNGMEFARQIETLHLPSKIVFVTAYSQYALEAWKTEAIDYVLKPFNIEAIKRSLLRAMVQSEAETCSGSVMIRCFPRFELIIDGHPKAFQSKKAKELLAYLVHNQGCWIDIGTLVYDLFGDLNEKSSKSHYRVILARLKKELSSCHAENMIESKYGAVRVNIPVEVCDYYMFLAGDRHLFCGEYMMDYSWAEEENARLVRKYMSD